MFSHLSEEEREILYVNPDSTFYETPSLREFHFIAMKRLKTMENRSGAAWFTSSAAEREEVYKILYPEISKGNLLVVFLPTFDASNLTPEQIEYEREKLHSIPKDIKGRIIYKGANKKGASEESNFMSISIEIHTPENLYSPNWGYEKTLPSAK
jgi:hypothetical protein